MSKGVNVFPPSFHTFARKAGGNSCRSSGKARYGKQRHVISTRTQMCRRTYMHSGQVGRHTMKGGDKDNQRSTTHVYSYVWIHMEISRSKGDIMFMFFYIVQLHICIYLSWRDRYIYIERGWNKHLWRSKLPTKLPFFIFCVLVFVCDGNDETRTKKGRRRRREKSKRV